MRMKPCAQCSLLFCSVRRKDKYCSYACAGAAKRTCYPLPCAQCGAVFTPPRVGVRYCSRKCVGLSLQRHNVSVCENCSGAFTPPRSTSKYCSVTCSGLAHRALPRRPKRMLTRIVKVEKARVLAVQGAACAACRTAFTRSRDAHLDHCHASGKIRGVLCRKCNTALGLLGDDPYKVKALLDYLSEWLTPDECGNVRPGNIPD